MKTSRAIFVVLTVFALTLCAGAVSGFLVARLPRVAIPPKSASAENSALADELELTADQREHMQAIWERVRVLADESYNGSRKLQDQRDDAVRALVPPDKMQDYNAIWRKYQDDNAVLKGRRDAAFDLAVKQTKEILSAPQQKKYDEILAKRLGAQGPAAHDSVGESVEAQRSRQTPS